MTEFQPTLPAEVAYTEAELNFWDESPPGLFPDNQDSNFGFIIRKVFSDRMQEVIDQIETLYQERFVSGSEIFLDRWEADLGLPIAPTGKTIVERQSIALGRVQTGPFTRPRVKSVIESYLQATFGEAVALTPEGVPLVPAGIPLYGEFAPVTALYRVYEDIRNFTYEVRIKNTSTPDIASMTRELQRITPAGIQFTIDNTVSNVLDYFKMIRTRQPEGYWRLDNDNDSSGNARNLTTTGSAWTLGAPIIESAVAGGSQAATKPAGAGNYKQASNFLQYLVKSGRWTIEAWVDVPAMSSGDTIVPISDFAWPGDGHIMYISWVSAGNPQNLYPAVALASTQYSPGNIPLATGRRHIVMVRETNSLLVYVDGALALSGNVPAGAGLGASGHLALGAGTKAQKLDELVAYNRPLSPVEILENFKTGTNVA